MKEVSQKERIKNLILCSFLLSPNRNAKLGQMLEKMPVEALDRLEQMLKAEPKIMEVLIQKAVSTAVDAGNSEVLEAFNAFFKDTKSRLLTAEEKGGKTLEEEEMDELLDQLTS